MTAEVGAAAPPFEGRDQHGAPLSLSSVLDGSRLLLVFVPWAFSGTCSGELRDLQDRQDDFAAAGVAVVVVSCDAMFSQRVWADTEGFSFRLLSDHWPHGDIARSYGVFDETAGVALRGSFLVGRDGAIRWAAVSGIGDRRAMGDVLAVATAWEP